MSKKAFTLAEVLITLAIIGVVAALTIPSVITNTQQQEFKTGLRKAVSVLNSAIQANIALEGETPYDNTDLFNYLQQHMNVMKSVKSRAVEDCSALNSPYLSGAVYAASVPSACSGEYITQNAAFYTTDGMLFEFAGNEDVRKSNSHPLHENNSIEVCMKTVPQAYYVSYSEDSYIDTIETDLCSGCGSLGLNNNDSGTTKPPCLITVDVNGDKKPNSPSIRNRQYIAPSDKKINDLFSIMITEKGAAPYGVVAQRAMYSK